jgi:hypothetical protein
MTIYHNNLITKKNPKKNKMKTQVKLTMVTSVSIQTPSKLIIQCQLNNTKAAKQRVKGHGLGLNPQV